LDQRGNSDLARGGSQRDSDELEQLYLLSEIQGSNSLIDIVLGL